MLRLIFEIIIEKEHSNERSVGGEVADCVSNAYKHYVEQNQVRHPVVYRTVMVINNAHDTTAVATLTFPLLLSGYGETSAHDTALPLFPLNT